MLGIPPLVPYGADQTIYLVVEASGPEAPTRTTEREDIETIITDLLSGRFSDPIKVVAYNTLEHWSEDLSRDVVQEVLCRCDIEGQEVPDYLEEFVSNSFIPPRQPDLEASSSNKSGA
jgi:hypothetical protein